MNKALWTLKGKSILVVDDFPDIRALVREMLKNFGATTIDVARNAEQCLELLADKRYDVVLCDYNLGDGKDGQQILEEARVRELVPYSSIFIMITAENTMNMVMGAVEYEPDAYLSKPFTQVVLESRLRKLEQKKAVLREISAAMDTRNLERALALCEQSLTQEKKHYFDIMKLRGDLQMRLHSFKAARAIFDEVIAIRPLSWALLGRGKALYELGEHAEAEQSFREAIAANAHFVAAFDWLARAEQAQGRIEAAQQTLKQAVELSPKNTARQKTLAEVSLKTNDLATAEAAYKAVVVEGRHSIHRKPKDFGAFAELKVHLDKPQEAAKLLGAVGREFKHASGEDQLMASMVESKIAGALGQDDVSAAALDRAMALHAKHPGTLRSEDALDLAASCFAAGRKEEAVGLMQAAVRSHHEDPAFLEQARAVFDQAGLADEGEQLIDTEHQAMIRLNNEGVALARDGKLRDSVVLFLKAAQSMPENTTINLNAAQSLLMLMSRQGADPRSLEQVRIYLTRVRGQAANQDRFDKIYNQYRQLATGTE